MVQSVDGKDLVNELAVAGDDPASKPVEQAFVGQLEPQRKQSAVTLFFFKQRADKAVQPLRPQVEGEQSRIILFQDEFHCLHRIFSGSRIFPKGEHDTQTHNNILLQTVKFNREYGDFQQCHLRINEIRHNSHPRRYPGRGGSRRERQPDIRETPEVCAHPRLSKCKFGTLKLHFGCGG